MRAWVGGLLLAVLLAPAAWAGPGAMVGSLSFQPPAGWVVLPGPDGLAIDIPAEPDVPPGAVSVTVTLLPPVPDAPPVAVAPLLRDFAEPAARLRSRIWQEEVAGHRAACVEATGTWVGPGDDPGRRPGHTLLAAIIDTAQGQVVARLLAPTELARRLAPAFWAMVRGAVVAPPA